MTDPPLPELPPAAAEILGAHRAPPRLIAHLRLVHDVAGKLVDWLPTAYDDVRFDREAVLFGAATHDIGKIIHPEELSGPGHLHEAAGQRLLLAAGVEPRLARFAATHGSWTAADVELEDLLVSLADKVWKAKRVAELEQLVVERLVAVSGRQTWEVFLELDDRLTHLAEGADERLSLQNSYSIT
jgi:hypothetical protein